MKPELTNLLHRLVAELDGFQALTVFPNGQAIATHRHGCHPFRSLDEVERFAYPAPQAASSELPAPSSALPAAPPGPTSTDVIPQAVASPAI